MKVLLSFVISLIFSQSILASTSMECLMTHSPSNETKFLTPLAGGKDSLVIIGRLQGYDTNIVANIEQKTARVTLTNGVSQSSSISGDILVPNTGDFEYLMAQTTGVSNTTRVQVSCRWLN